MPSRVISCERCGDTLGILADGVFSSSHHQRRFLDPVVVECRCGWVWVNPDVQIDDERAKRLARVLQPHIAATAAS